MTSLSEMTEFYFPMKKYWLLSVLLLSAHFLVAQNDKDNKDFPPRPSPARLVNDLTGTLTSGQILNLEARLERLNDTSSSQVAVVILHSIGSYDISDYTVRLFKKWGIGQKDKNNGVLLLIALDDHKMDITNGYGLEGVLTDIESKQILDNVIKPYFKEKKYYEGINQGVDAIAKAVAGEYKADNTKTDDSSDGWVALVFIAIIVIFFIISAMNRRKGGGGGFMGGGGIPFIFFGGGGSSGGFDGGGGGGGFDFGGGDSGGGGASSSW